MKEDEKRQLIEKYISAYNSFDVEGMMSVLHREIEFKNISSGEVIASATGESEFRKLAEQAKAIFTTRKQTINKFSEFNDRTSIEISYEGVLATDLPNGMKSDETLRLNGRSEFFFRDGKISQITDIS